MKAKVSLENLCDVILKDIPEADIAKAIIYLMERMNERKPFMVISKYVHKETIAQKVQS